MANAATAPGNQQPPLPPDMHDCGEVGAYGELKASGRAQDPSTRRNVFERDHIPAKRTLLERAKVKKRGMKQTQIDCVAKQVEKNGRAIVIPAPAHRGYSPTCGSRNKPLYPADATSAKKMNAAVERDIEEMQSHLNGNPPDVPADPCAGAYAAAAAELKEFDFEKMIDEAIKHCVP
jgi:hypothetical protein